MQLVSQYCIVAEEESLLLPYRFDDTGFSAFLSDTLRAFSPRVRDFENS